VLVPQSEGGDPNDRREPTFEELEKSPLVESWTDSVIPLCCGDSGHLPTTSSQPLELKEHDRPLFLPGGESHLEGRLEVDVS